MKMKIKTVEDVAAWQLCCGCGACASVCPEIVEMVDTLDHGRRPRFREGQDGFSTDDTMKVCPAISLSRLPKPDGQIGGDSYYDRWGAVLGVWEGYAADPQIRYKGSSGGVASALALYGMEKLGIKGALHIRSREDIPYLNRTVLSTNREELLTGAGSRYAPASPCDGLGQIEVAERPCVFIGKPCDVAAVHKGEEMRPQLKDKIGLTIAFFCAGTPSTNGTLEMLRQMGIEDTSFVTALRYRGCGWPGMAKVEYTDNEGIIRTQQLTYEESWSNVLQKYRHWRCYICPDHIGEFADIALADAWHLPIQDYQPGCSVVIARSKRGLNFIRQAQQQGYIILEKAKPQILSQCMPWHTSLKGQLWARITMLKILGVPMPKYKNFNLFHLWRTELTFRDKIWSIVSTIKRLFVKKLYRKRNIIRYPFSSNQSCQSQLKPKE